MQPPPQAVPTGAGGPPPLGPSWNMYWRSGPPGKRANPPAGPTSSPVRPVTDPFAFGTQAPRGSPLGSSAKGDPSAVPAFPPCHFLHLLLTSHLLRAMQGTILMGRALPCLLSSLSLERASHLPSLRTLQTGRSAAQTSPQDRWILQPPVKTPFADTKGRLLCPRDLQASRISAGTLPTLVPHRLPSLSTPLCLSGGALTGARIPRDTCTRPTRSHRLQAPLIRVLPRPSGFCSLTRLWISARVLHSSRLPQRPRRRPPPWPATPRAQRLPTAPRGGTRGIPSCGRRRLSFPKNTSTCSPWRRRLPPLSSRALGKTPRRLSLKACRKQPASRPRPTPLRGRCRCFSKGRRPRMRRSSCPRGDARTAKRTSRRSSRRWGTRTTSRCTATRPQPLPSPRRHRMPCPPRRPCRRTPPPLSMPSGPRAAIRHPGRRPRRLQRRESRSRRPRGPAVRKRGEPGVRSEPGGPAKRAPRPAPTGRAFRREPVRFALGPFPAPGERGEPYGRRAESRSSRFRAAPGAAGQRLFRLQPPQPSQPRLLRPAPRAGNLHPAGEREARRRGGLFRQLLPADRLLAFRRGG
ncbi:hypothetical protein JRQ81_008973 [Phrynocephalus forsythii]|uniref:Uncharacterized protein n=1 Tax=Phrynocephalus forsythii TaxID=171643 RepID=A0A9Q0XBJ6_9SAUR|nr:hypothetical protein JRQ81_008973 [Phrynocephalus forsythii]